MTILLALLALLLVPSTRRRKSATLTVVLLWLDVTLLMFIGLGKPPLQRGVLLRTGLRPTTTAHHHAAGLARPASAAPSPTTSRR